MKDSTVRRFVWGGFFNCVKLHGPMYSVGIDTNLLSFQTMDSLHLYNVSATCNNSESSNPNCAY